MDRSARPPFQLVASAVNFWKSRTYQFFAAATILVFSIFAILGTPRGHSYNLNVSWFSAFEAAFWNGVLYPRHLPELWYGAGGLDFFFYGPLPFWTTALLGRPLCPNCPVNTVFSIGGAWLLVLSGLAFYVFARRFMDRTTAITASLAYMVLPYHLVVDWFIRQSVGEFAAYIFVPLMARAFADLLDRKSGGTLFAVAFAGLLLSHLPSALLAAHVFAAVFLAWSWTRRNDWRAISQSGLRLASWGCLGAALSSFYWLPALVLIGDVSAGALYTPHFTASNWLLFDGRPEPDRTMGTIVTVCLIAGIAICLAASFPGVVVSDRLRLWIIAPAAVVAFLMTGASAFIWNNWLISMTQFPWRLLLFLDLSSALAIGMLANMITARQVVIGVGILAGVAMIAAAYVGTLPNSFGAVAKAFQNRHEPPETSGAREYLPAPLFRHIERTRGSSLNEFWDHRHKEIVRKLAESAMAGGRIVEHKSRAVVVAAAAGGAVIVPIPYWPHWRAMVVSTSEPVELAANRPEGLVTFTPPPGAKHVRLFLPYHWSEYAGLAFLLGSILILCLTAFRNSLTDT